MTSFLQIYNQRSTINDKFFTMLEDAQEHREIEFKSAVKIQIAFRRFIFKQMYAERNKKAMIIQRTFRKYRAQMYVQCLRVEKTCEDRIQYFNQMTKKIQNCWRTYVIRNNIPIPNPVRAKDGNQKIIIRKIKKVIKKKLREPFNKPSPRNFTRMLPAGNFMEFSNILMPNSSKSQTRTNTII